MRMVDRAFQAPQPLAHSPEMAMPDALMPGSLA
jgi:hypothetical protein